MEILDDLGKTKPIPKEATKVFQGEIFSTWQWQQKLYDGSYATFEALRRPDTAHTIGVLPSGEILLIEDEQPNRGVVLTPPGGVVDEGETPAEAASREMLEETGYAIGQLVPWHVYQASTKMDWKIYAYVGRGLTKVSEPTLEPGEKVSVRTFSFEEFLELGHSSLLRDRIIRILLLEALLDTKKRQELKDLFYG